MPFLKSIFRDKVQYEHISVVKNKLGSSESVLKGFCRDGILQCIKIGGSWYVSEHSLVRGAKQIHKNKVHKVLKAIKNLKNQK